MMEEQKKNNNFVKLYTHIILFYQKLSFGDIFNFSFFRQMSYSIVDQQQDLHNQDNIF